MKIVLHSMAKDTALETFSGTYDPELLDKLGTAELFGARVPIVKRDYRLDGSGDLCCDLHVDDRVFWLERLSKNHPNLAKFIAVLLAIGVLVIVGLILSFAFLFSPETRLAVLGFAYFHGDYLIWILTLIVVFRVQAAVTKPFGQDVAVAAGMVITVVAIVAAVAWDSRVLNGASAEVWPDGYAGLARTLNGTASAIYAQLLVAAPLAVALLQLFNKGRLADFVKFLGSKKK